MMNQEQREAMYVRYLREKLTIVDQLSQDIVSEEEEEATMLKRVEKLDMLMAYCRDASSMQQGLTQFENQKQINTATGSSPAEA